MHNRRKTVCLFNDDSGKLNNSKRRGNRERALDGSSSSSIRKSKGRKRRERISSKLSKLLLLLLLQVDQKDQQQRSDGLYAMHSGIELRVGIALGNKIH